MTKIKKYSKSKVKCKCKKMYLYDDGTSIAALLGGVRHLILEKSLEGLKMNKHMVGQICDANGVPEIFYEDVFFDYKCWYINTGKEIKDDYDIISIESKESKSFKHGKPIAQIMLTDSIMFQGMLDVVCCHKITKKNKVIDWKSGYIKEYPEIELIANGLMAMLVHDIPKLVSEVYSLAADSTHKLEMNIGEKDKYVDILLKEINKFEAMPDDHTELSTLCQYCGLRSTCEDYLNSLFGMPSVNIGSTKRENIEECFRLKQIASFAKAEADKLQKLIMSKYDLEEIIADDMIYYFKGKNSSSYDTQGIYDSIEAMGLNPNALIGIKAGDIKKFLFKVKEDYPRDVWKAAKGIIEGLTTKTMGPPSLKKRQVKKL